MGRRLANLLAGLIYCFLLLPTLIVIPISFDGSGVIAFPPLQPSLKLYREFLFDPSWMTAALHSLVVAVCSLAVALSIGVPAAFALGRRVFRQQRAERLVHRSARPADRRHRARYLSVFFPFAPDWNDTGVGAGSRRLHHALRFRDDKCRAPSGHLLAETAAALMGAGWFTIFFRVTLPQLWQSVVSAALLAFLMSFDEVVIAWFITDATTGDAARQNVQFDPMGGVADLERFTLPRWCRCWSVSSCTGSSR